MQLSIWSCNENGDNYDTSYDQDNEMKKTSTLDSSDKLGASGRVFAFLSKPIKMLHFMWKHEMGVNLLSGLTLISMCMLHKKKGFASLAYRYSRSNYCQK